MTSADKYLATAGNDGAVSMAIWALIIFATVASMAIAERMARARGRSVKGWVWTGAIVGPLSPLALYALGNRPTPVP